MPKFARSDEPKVSQCRMNVKVQESEIFDTCIFLAASLSTSGREKGWGESNGQNSTTQAKSFRSFKIGVLNYVENTFPNPSNPPLQRGGEGDL